MREISRSSTLDETNLSEFKFRPLAAIFRLSLMFDHSNRLGKEYVEREIRKKPSILELEERALMEIMVSEKGADGLLNVPLKDGSLWVEELRNGRLVLNLGGLDDPKMTCVELHLEHGDLTQETVKARDVRYVILGDIPDMGKTRFVRMRGGIKEVELEGED